MENLLIDFSNLKNLKKLILWDNGHDLLNETVLECNRIEYLETSMYHDYISNLQNLKILAINNVDNDTDINSLPKLILLEDLHFHYFRKDSIDPILTTLPNLRNLSISGSGKPSMNKAPLHFPKLEYLGIHVDYIKEFPVFDLPSIKYIHYAIVDKRITIVIPRTILSYPNLSRLNIVGQGTVRLDFKKEEMKFKLIAHSATILAQE